MSLVNAHNEWDPLREVIIGTIRGAQIPRPGTDLHTVEYPTLQRPEDIPSGSFPQHVIDQTALELDQLSATLTELGVTVRRPGPRDPAAAFSTPEWSTDGFYDYCPRDVLLTIGQTVIETPMVLRSRFLEPFAYKDLLLEYFDSGARWLSAPKPRLADDLYDLSREAGSRLLNTEPAFDAANVLRFGTDILYLVSDSGNELGARWLQSTLGEPYTVHACRGLYSSTHVDSTIIPLRPGLVLLNPERVNDDNMPAFLRGWDKIWCPELVDIGFEGENPYCSVWIGMNLLVVRPGMVIVDDRQKDLIRSLEAHGVDVVPQRLTHSRTLGGGFHCVSLDVRRDGTLDTYR
ncbi:inosamine-phosphate amidinotransferase 1 [Streptomyces populi]|jgi:glycine amidinotransferase/scyllo-inosamine-4-phosphate amidinotransferase 1